MKEEILKELKEAVYENIELYPKSWIVEDIRLTLKSYIEDWQGYTGEYDKLTSEECHFAFEKLYCNDFIDKIYLELSEDKEQYLFEKKCKSLVKYLIDNTKDYDAERCRKYINKEFKWWNKSPKFE